jgi:hypothetical protein
MNRNLKPVIIAVFCMFLFPVLSQSACLMGAKIQPTLCGHLDSVQSSDLVPVNITLYEPIFHIYGCERFEPPPLDPHVCGTVVDSIAAYWTLHKQDVLRVFSDCPVYDSANTSRRLDSTDFNTTRNYFGLATKQTIAALAAESLVVMLDLGFYFRLPDAALQSTAFPFDTTIINLVQLTDSNRVVVRGTYMVGSSTFASISIPRYGLPFVLYRNATPTICPLGLWGDFVLSTSDTVRIKYPQDQTQLYTAYDCCGGVPRCSSWARIDTSILTHEYRFRTETSFLYMKVMEGSKPDSIKLRFDTKSFLGTAVVRAPGSRANQSGTVLSQRGAAFSASLRNAMLHGASISVYSIAGKKIAPTALMRSGIVVVKKIENGRISYTRNVLAW